jgi:methyltransferase
LLAIGAQRLGELVLSRRNQKRLFAQGGERAKEPLFPLMVFVHVGFLLAALAEVGLWQRPYSPLVGGASIVALVLAQLLRVWVLVTLRQSWNVQVVVPRSLRVVSAGPYAWIRHPNYLAVIVEIAAIPLVHGAYLSAVAFSALNGFVLSRRIAIEEEALFLVPGYRESMGHKPRFLPF